MKRRSDKDIFGFCFALFGGDLWIMYRDWDLFNSTSDFCFTVLSMYDQDGVLPVDVCYHTGSFIVRRSFRALNLLRDCSVSSWSNFTNTKVPILRTHRRKRHLAANVLSV